MCGNRSDYYMKTGRKDVSMDKENHCDDREAKIIRERRDELYMNTASGRG